MKRLLLIIVFLTTYSLNAQKSLPGFDKITQEQINLTSVSFEKDADAVILSEIGQISISGRDYYIDVKKRVKILTEQGKKNANIEIEYYSNQNLESISDLKGQTINQENNQFVNYPLDYKEIFDVKVNDYYSVKRITFPNIKVGSIIEYQYRVTGNHLYLINAWDFQHLLPTLNSKFRAEVTGYLDYTNLLIGKRLVEKYENKNSKSEWELTNVPSIKEIKFAYNNKDYSERIRLQLKGYYGEKANVFGNTVEYKTAIHTWKDLKKELSANNDRFLNEAYVSKLAIEIPDGTTQLETLKNVVNYFNKNFRWNYFRSIFLSETQRTIVDKRTGNLADLNALFQTLLKAKNIKSDLLLVSTRQHGKLMTNFPYLNQFDAIINLVELNDKSTYIINAANVSVEQLKFPSLHIFNDLAFNINAKEDVFLNLKPFLSSYESNMTYTIQDNNEIMETRKEMFDGYFYHENSKDKTDLIHQYLNSAINTTYDDVNNKKIFYDSTDEKHKIMAVGKTIINENNNFYILENPLKHYLSTFLFNEKDRKNNIEFNFPQYFVINVKVKIPEGYKVVPPIDFTKTLQPNENLLYHQNFIVKDNSIQLLIQFLSKKSVYEYKEYSTLKNFFDAAQKLSQQEFIIKKN
ncbi:DUF3857 domain-containing protein [Empedobacter brevis]|uniref:DUF3857 domain-containing protein n=1 Tax=Empedobacter brevis TaxID=247 RepID=UPI0033425E33